MGSREGRKVVISVFFFGNFNSKKDQTNIAKCLCRRVVSLAGTPPGDGHNYQDWTNIMMEIMNYYEEHQ